MNKQRKGQKIIVILGPTASGKSELAVKLAKKFNGEIVSADSRQVYKGLDIGSGKVAGKWKIESGKWKKENPFPETTLYPLHSTFYYKGVPHHCLDIVSPKKVFSVVEYKQYAEKAIENILLRGKVPIICGGTGFYIQAIVDNLVLPEVAPNPELRKKLEKKTTEELFKILKKLDPVRAKNIDAKNPHRLIRAIEIAKTLGKVPHLDVGRLSSLSKYEFLQIGINPTKEELQKKISKRIKGMISEGLLKEIEGLRKSPSQGGQGLTWKRIYELGFEYKYPVMFLRGKMNKEDMLEKMITENYKYAKRQMTWFKRTKKIRWFTLSEVEGLNDTKETEKLVEEFLK